MGNSTSMPKPEEGLRIVTQTWQKESHQLFDYYCTDLDERLFNVKSPGFLMRNLNLVVFNELPVKDYEVLMEIRYGVKETTVLQPRHNPNHNQQIDELWLAVQQDRQVPLTVGDLVRMGRVEFKVREIGLRGARQPLRSSAQAGTFYTEENLRASAAKLENSRGSNRCLPQCRICFARDPSQQNPLIAPCNCKGSLEYIHLLCLREWLETKVTKKIYPMANYYSWKNLRCQICASDLADQYTHGGRTFDVFEFTKPLEPYIVLERTQVKQDGKKMSVCITKLCQNVQTKLGRGQQVHVKINDISVSRHHSSLTLRKGRVYLSDKTSKFGTLVRLREGIVVPNNLDLWLQCGRTLIKFENSPPQVNNCCCQGP